MVVSLVTSEHNPHYLPGILKVAPLVDVPTATCPVYGNTDVN